MTVKEARAFIDDHREGTYTLLDVCQTPEYEIGHLPGAKLIPLPQLPDRFNELSPEKPIIVY
jgi:rhodanese-related sulfurtransferase